MRKGLIPKTGTRFVWTNQLLTGGYSKEQLKLHWHQVQLTDPTARLDRPRAVKVLPSKPAVGQTIAMFASPAASNVSFANVHLPSEWNKRDKNIPPIFFSFSTFQDRFGEELSKQ